MQARSFPFQRFYHGYLAFIYAFTYRTTRRTFFGFTISSWIKTASLILLLATWLRNWEPVITGVAVPVAVVVFLVYWRSRRAGYMKFIPDSTAAVPAVEPSPLPSNQRIDLWATGVFAVQDWEDYLLLRKGQYWQVSLGDHIVMVQAGNDKFLYQFFSAGKIQDVTLGCLLFGTRLHETIAITFLESQHSVEPLQFNFAKPEDITHPTQKRTIYFTFADAETKRTVWHNIVYDIQQVRP